MWGEEVPLRGPQGVLPQAQTPQEIHSTSVTRCGTIPDVDYNTLSFFPLRPLTHGLTSSQGFFHWTHLRS